MQYVLHCADSWRPQSRFSLDDVFDQDFKFNVKQVWNALGLNIFWADKLNGSLKPLTQNN